MLKRLLLRIRTKRRVKINPRGKRIDGNKVFRNGYY